MACEFPVAVKAKLMLAANHCLLYLQRFYRQNIERSSSCLNYLFRVQRDNVVNKLRRANKYELFLDKTQLFRNFYIPYCVAKFLQH